MKKYNVEITEIALSLLENHLKFLANNSSMDNSKWM